ncbi:MAG: hypothetical protein GEV03_28865 [Streptosporangiales bacterium]|nr:hypothetical protein [Streptosporangiales bacterium]
MLRAARELLAVRSPLDAELMVSELLGTWWGQRLSDADVEEVLGEALVDHAAQANTPAALALLTGIAYLGTHGQSAKAEQAALALIDQGVARPRWADQVGAVAADDCWTSKDVYGDQETAICTFSYRGEERHALVALVDYNLGGMMKDAWVSSEVDKLLEYCRQEARDNPLMRLESLRPSRARAILQAALDETDAADHPPVNESFGSYHAFVRARVRALRPGRAGGSPPTFSRDTRAALAVEFLASDEAEELSDPSAAGRCADTIIDYGCDLDFGRPLRVSPTKTEVFMLDWLPRKVLLTPEEQEAMPHVLAAWTRWAGKQMGLPERCVGATLDAVWNTTTKFADTYAASAYSLPRQVVERLLPDRDLEALPRRTFAFPLLEGTHGGMDLGALDPTDPEDRRQLLRVEHLGHSGKDRDTHLALHEVVAEQLWDGKPAETWETVQRLLDAGYERHDVLHMIMDAVERSGGRSYDIKRLRRALDQLPDTL